MAHERKGHLKLAWYVGNEGPWLGQRVSESRTKWRKAHKLGIAIRVDVHQLSDEVSIGRRGADPQMQLRTTAHFKLLFPRFGCVDQDVVEPLDWALVVRAERKNRKEWLGTSDPGRHERLVDVGICRFCAWGCGYEATVPRQPASSLVRGSKGRASSGQCFRGRSADTTGRRRWRTARWGPHDRRRCRCL